MAITTLPIMSGFGSAHPTNRYDVGLIRPGDPSGYLDAIPITGGPQRIDLAAGIDRIGYSIFGSGVVSVTESVGPATIVFTSVDGTTVSGTAAITIEWENVVGATPNDWITIQPTTEPLDTSNRYFGSGGFEYTSSCSNTPGTAARVSGTCAGTLNSAPSGTYESRLYSNDTLVLLARGPSFTVA